MEQSDSVQPDELRSQLRALEEELAAARSQIERHRTEARDIEKRFRTIEQQRDQLLASLEEARNTLSTFTRSRSWRLTKPLRVLTQPAAKNRSRKAELPAVTQRLDAFHRARHQVLRRRAAELVRKHSLPNGSDGPLVDVVIPVYRGLQETHQCLKAILASQQQTPFDLVVVNDATPDRRLRDLLEELAGLQRLTLITNKTNLGYVASANLGFALHPSRDVVLLNSDTEPAGDWLDRLRAHALQSSNVATVTPFSNNAALASYPQMSEYNPLPSDLTVQQLDELFRTVNSGTSIPLAAGHGSAMYMTRACLDDVGFFDHVVFGPGYGEEADFCARASRRGWTNLLACDVFVKHVGAVSFGSDRQTLRRAGLERFIAIHPDDPGIRAAYRADDPPREYRLNVDIARVNASSRRIVLLVNGREDLASAMYRDNLVRALKEQVEFVLLGADPERPRRLVLTRLPSGERLNADVHRYDEERLVEVVERIHIDRVHYQDVHRDDHVLEVAERLAVPYDVSVHDFRRISLLPDRTRPFIEGAARVFVPNIFAAERVLRHYPDASVLVVPLEQLEGPADEPSTAPTVIEDETLRILTIGSLRAAQGADILEAAAIDARRRDLPLEFHLLGSAVPPLAAFPGSNLHIYEPRGERDLIQSIHRVDPHLCWFPWREPEVGSVDLGAALHAGLPVIASDLGDVRERLAGRRHSWAVDPQIPAERWNDLFIRLRSGDQLKEHAVPAERRNQDVSDFRYTLDYIGSAADLAVTVDRR